MPPLPKKQGGLGNTTGDASGLNVTAAFPAGSGADPASAQMLSAVMAQVVRPELTGVDTSGLTDAGPKISTMLRTAMRTGRTAVFDKGIYCLKSSVNVTLTANLKVECHPEAVFILDASLQSKGIYLHNDANSGIGPFSVKWRGGRVDATAAANSPPGQAWDSLTWSENVIDCVVEDVTFIFAILGSPMSQGLGKPAVTAGGSGYTSTPTVVIPAPDQAGGRQAVGVATISGGAVTGFRFTDNGRGYSTVPAITLTGGGGSGATVSASIVADYRTAGGDSGIFCVGKRGAIRNCRFIGAQDCGVYASALADGSLGEALTITGCYFINCSAGVDAKRGFKRFIVGHNYFYGCTTDIATAEGDAGQPPGMALNAFSNIHKFTVYNAIVARIADGSVIVSNLIEDFGYDPDGNGVYGAIAIWVQGSKGCAVTGNTVRFRERASTSSLVAVSCAARVFNGTTYNSTGNGCTGNTIDGVATAFNESDANQDNNHYGPNKITGAGLADYTLLGPNSTIIRSGAGNVGIDASQTSLGGPKGSEALRAVRNAGATQFVQIDGTAASSGASITFSSDSVSAPNGTITTKGGAGVLLFNGGAGNEALRVSTGVVGGNAVQITGAAAAADPTISSRGAGTNIGLKLSGIGTGALTAAFPTVYLGGVKGSDALRVVGAVGGTSNFIEIDGSAGGIPILTTNSDTNASVNLGISTKGGVILLNGAAGAEACRIASGVSGGNAVEIGARASGSSPYVAVRGADANADLSVIGKGTGGGRCIDGAGTIQMRWGTAGLGFFGAALAARQSAPSALATDGTATNAAIASAVNALRTNLVNLGLAA